MAVQSANPQAAGDCLKFRVTARPFQPRRALTGFSIAHRPANPSVLMTENRSEEGWRFVCRSKRVGSGSGFQLLDLSFAFLARLLPPIRLLQTIFRRLLSVNPWRLETGVARNPFVERAGNLWRTILAVHERTSCHNRASEDHGNETLPATGRFGPPSKSTTVFPGGGEEVNSVFVFVSSRA